MLQGSPSTIEAQQFSIYQWTRCNMTSESLSSDYYNRVSQPQADARPSKYTGLTSLQFGCGVTRTSPKLDGSVWGGGGG